MSLQFTVPQFIDIEDKIFGPISVRQFAVIIVGGIIIAAEYFIFTFFIFIFIALITAGLVALFAFFKINGQYFHYFLLNVANTLRHPAVRLWSKQLNVEDIQQAQQKEKEVGILVPARLAPSSSRLRELSLIVDTGGAYGEESWEISREKEMI